MLITMSKTDPTERITMWNPRGKPTWPDWKTAKPGTRVRHVRSGATGTFVRVAGGKHKVAVIDWDGIGCGTSRGRVVAPAFDLEPPR